MKGRVGIPPEENLGQRIPLEEAEGILSPPKNKGIQLLVSVSVSIILPEKPVKSYVTSDL